jgi:hypothetical protein
MFPKKVILQLKGKQKDRLSFEEKKKLTTVNLNWQETSDFSTEVVPVLNPGVQILNRDGPERIFVLFHLPN